MTEESNRGSTYAGAGVDIAAGDRAIELIKPWAAKATRPEVVGGLGGFAALFALDIGKYRKPLLASSTDGVGTKLAIAQALGKHDTIGRDLVAMVVDDIVVCGAEPLFMQDYVACGRVIPERLAEIVSGVAEGCRLAGCALVGGETAEHPGLLEPDDYDVAGTAVGVVEADEVLGPERVAAGDVVIAMGSSGLHSNGYSLVRHVLLGQAELSLRSSIDDLGSDRTLGEELLEPTRIYALDCLALIAAADVHAFVHITGGGIPGNVPRIIPEGLQAVIDRSTWRPQPVFDLIASTGNVSAAEMEHAFNLGIGMTAILPAADADAALTLLAERDVPAWVCGELVATDDTELTRLVGKHPSA